MLTDPVRGTQVPKVITPSVRPTKHDSMTYRPAKPRIALRLNLRRPSDSPDADCSTKVSRV